VELAPKFMQVKSITTPSPYIIGPVHDSLWLIFSPVISLLLGFALMLKIFAWKTQFIGPEPHRLIFYIAIAFTQGHLIATFIRTHGNLAIYRQYRWRFTAVPLILFVSIYTSPWISAFALFIAVFWDIYHSCLQTFGIGRIYDAKVGNDPLAGRRLDICFNILLYLGPLAAGASLIPHFSNAVAGFSHLPNDTSAVAMLFSSMPQTVGTYIIEVRIAVCTIAAIVMIAIFLEYSRLRGQGYSVPWQKVALFASTGTCSIIAWGFNPLGIAWAVMNIFHAVQYFALVWHTENRNMQVRFGFGSRPVVNHSMLAAYLVIFLTGGLILDQLNTRISDSLIFSCALLHFWYDSFIWSVQRRQHLQVSQPA